MSAGLPRSYLFVPGNRHERFDKARAAGADAVILDLEDAVPPEDKPAARTAVVRVLDALTVAGASGEARCVMVRINAFDTPWFADDVAALAGHAGVAGIVLPKAEMRTQIEAVLAHAHGGLTVLPIIETARGIANVSELCGSPHVTRMVFGTLDFQMDLGIEGDDEVLNAFRSQIVLASRLANLAAPVDGVSTALDDAAVIEADARRGRRFGFGGKLCIHPKQIDPVHCAYAWSNAEQTWARRVLEAIELSGGAAVQLDGKMVDLPVIRKARQIMGAT